MAALEWKKPLSIERERKSDAKTSEGKARDIVARNQFEADYDRIVGSSSVRRLQDKAQVFPLQENDNTRTRLTHSIEVSALARSLGKAVGKQLEKRSIFTSDQVDEFASLLQTAGLIHDLGNPPFGHYGEEVIRQWFKEWFESEKILKSGIVMKDQEKNDFIYFDGNVQNLRIVTRLQTLNDIHGANFTYATLATIIKYPWRSDRRPDGKKKFGYFKSEENLIRKIQEETGLEDGIRHPATYLLEAADDIIYICDDIEDGAKKGYIDWEAEYINLKKNVRKAHGCSERYDDLFDAIEGKNKKIDEQMDQSEKEVAKVRNFRNFTQTYLFQEVVREFISNYEDIMAGQYKAGELLQANDVLVNGLKKITRDNCFSCHEVLALELVGDKVIRTLLNIFVEILINHSGEELLDTRTYAGKVFKLISANFIYIAENEHEDIRKLETEAEKLDALKVYDKLHLAVDFVSGMTDSYAVNLYKELTGIRLPK